LYCLGAAGTEVGTIPEFGQPGNPQPRLWTINSDHSVGLNRLGFNSIGAEGVEKKLLKHAKIPGVLGINVGKNKELVDDHSPEYHAKVVTRFNPMASYFVFNPSSPNTPGLTEKQKKGPMRDHLGAIMEVARKPVFVKYSPDIDYKDLDESVEVVIESGCAGLVLTNTTSDGQIRAQYGSRWAKEAGGLSGDDSQYRAKATAILRHAYEEYGDLLDIFGVGGVKDAATALEKIKSGGSAVQVLTAIRPSRGRVIAQINRGLVEYMRREGVTNIQDLIGVETKRGPKYPKAA
jgi:dihydroorotate dehydrogenase